MEQMTHPQSTIVSKLIPHHLMRHEPANEDAREESHDRQEYLSGHEVEDVEERLLEEVEHCARRS